MINDGVVCRYLYSDREFDNSEAGQPWCYE